MAKADASRSINGTMMGQELREISRCPHCGIASPRLIRAWASEGTTRTQNGRDGDYWGAYLCASCGSMTATKARFHVNEFVVTHLYPEPKQAHTDVPDAARNFLQQAFDTLHAPDAAAVMAGSAVDSMLKAKGLEEGSLYKRIDEALAANLLTQGMADWAHSVRLGSNRPRHADAEKPHVSPEEARQSVEFAEALGTFLFVLTARIERGIVAAQAADDS